MKKVITLFLIGFLIGILYLGYAYIENQKYIAFVECHEKEILAPTVNDINQGTIGTWYDLCNVIFNHHVSKNGAYEGNF